jgi:hypothetical protein
LGLAAAVSTSASKVYSGPLMLAIHAALPNVVPPEDEGDFEDDRFQHGSTLSAKSY